MVDTFCREERSALWPENLMSNKLKRDCIHTCALHELTQAPKPATWGEGEERNLNQDQMAAGKGWGWGGRLFFSS